MDYKQTLDYMYSQLPMFTRVGAVAIKKDLGNTIALCSALNNPHKKFKTIHVAGTNGKGSVSHILASVFQSAGYKTGLYTSPHLKDFRERIKINGQMIPQQQVIDFVAQNKPIFETIKPSFFEMTVALSFNYFAQQQVDIAIIETGLGGRLDSTNIISPELSVITNIGYDHMDMLGDTLPLIAAEKAGIIKQNTPVVIGETHPETETVFTNKAKSLNAPILFADKHYTIQPYESSGDTISVKITQSNTAKATELTCDLTGIYQKQNIVTAYAAIKQMQKLDWQLSPQSIENGFANVKSNTGLMGRWQKLATSPLTYADTGHNYDGIKHIITQINQQQFQNLHIVWGMVKDKAIDKILALLPQNATYYFCAANIPRALAAEELKQQASHFNLAGNTYSSVEAAVQAANVAATKSDMIFIGGSTFIVAEAV